MTKNRVAAGNYLDGAQEGVELFLTLAAKQHQRQLHGPLLGVGVRIGSPNEKMVS